MSETATEMRNLTFTLSSNSKRGCSSVPRVAAPSHRHAAPSAPWPWLDLHTSLSDKPADAPKYAQSDGWIGYPQVQYPNWTPDQQSRSGIAGIISHYSKDEECQIYQLDIGEDGLFRSKDIIQIAEDKHSIEESWQKLKEERPDGTRSRALFVDNMSGPALQMIGTQFNIEPFFFSSSLKWIPSRFQSNTVLGSQDHITFSLIFVGTEPLELRDSATEASRLDLGSLDEKRPQKEEEEEEEKQMIDVQKPLLLKPTERPGQMLYQDLLSVHMVRSISGSTIVSYHSPQSKFYGTNAEKLFKRIRFAGQSVYWQHIFRDSKDPTCLLLTFLWHAVYSWDEAQEVLYKHICYLESLVMETNEMRLTQELHIIRAHILHYESLLDDFRKTVNFVKNTPNPAMATVVDSSSSSSAMEEDSVTLDGALSDHLLFRECDHLLSEIVRLKETLDMQDKRLKNVMHLTFSLVNIEDSRRMSQLAEASGKDSSAMRQISSLTMIFLPGSLVATVFGMNVTEINEGSSPHIWLYFAAAFPLTFITVWIAVALQVRNEILAEKVRQSKERMVSSAQPLHWWWQDGEELSPWAGLWWPCRYASSFTPIAMKESQDIETATVTISPTTTGPPDSKTRRYDRQLRLWAASGQSALESARVLVIGGTATSTSTLKNLVLPGVGHFTILDSAKVTPADAGNNFFLDGQKSVGKYRAEEAVKLLLELNDGVEGMSDTRTLEEVLDKDPSWISGFTIVIAHNLDAKLLDRLAKYLWADETSPSLVVIRSSGFISEFYIQYHEHTIIESHSETAPSLRIDKPFPALLEYAKSLDFANMDPTEHSHIPYVVILVRALEDWRSQHNGLPPQNYAEKQEFKKNLAAMKIKVDEENFDEAEAQAYKAWTSTNVPSEIAEIFTDSRVANVTPSSPPFFVLAAALKKFTEQEPFTLPLSSTLPDMKSNTANYVHLQRLYKTRAEEDKKTLKELLSVPVDDALLDSFVKNAHGLKLLKGKPWEALDGDSGSLSNAAAAFPKSLAGHLALSALSSLKSKDASVTPTVEALATEAQAISSDLTENWDDVVGEVARAPFADLPNVAAFLGGMVAQEVIKMITKQYVPINGYCVADLVESWTGTI
ncbi:hypothetical protein ONZ45_g13834 [Pleurotus djamor]|nr:hypothetical protein ONZ45_g13834 [Pleurotus djamor]